MPLAEQQKSAGLAAQAPAAVQVDEMQLPVLAPVVAQMVVTPKLASLWHCASVVHLAQWPARQRAPFEFPTHWASSVQLFVPEPLPELEPEPLPALEPEPLPTPEPEPLPDPLPTLEPEPLPTVDPEPLPMLDPEPLPPSMATGESMPESTGGDAWSAPDPESCGGLVASPFPESLFPESALPVEESLLPVDASEAAVPSGPASPMLTAASLPPQPTSASPRQPTTTVPRTTNAPIDDRPLRLVL